MKNDYSHSTNVLGFFLHCLGQVFPSFVQLATPQYVNLIAGLGGAWEGRSRRRWAGTPSVSHSAGPRASRWGKEERKKNTFFNTIRPLADPGQYPDVMGLCVPPATRLTGDYWSKSLSLILADLKRFAGFWRFKDFFWKTFGILGLCKPLIVRNSLTCLMGWRVTGERWHATRNMWHVTPYRLHMKHAFGLCFRISATIRTRQEIQCLRCVGFL